MMNSGRLSVETWREPDPTSTQFALPSAGLRQQADPDGWAAAFLAVELDDQVPEDVRELFDVARAAMLYGWFYYPLLRLGEEHLARVTESAARARYRQLGGSDDRPRFADVIKWLARRGAITETEKDRWLTIRKGRNLASHPERRGLVPPDHALRVLRALAQDIDRLFSDAPAG